jgi:hypothetical protein
MLFTGQITSANTYEIMSDSVTLTGTLCGRPCTITVQCAGVAEILVGQLGFKREGAVIELKGVEE